MRITKNIRLDEYDYRSNGYYFITICTNYRRPYLIGEKKNVVAQFIEQIPIKTKGVELDYYEVMSTHIHKILILERSELKLGEIVRRFKARTKRFFGFSLWQPNYYEHVIRNDTALSKIREYIKNNPEIEKIEFRQFYDKDKQVQPHK